MKLEFLTGGGGFDKLSSWQRSRWSLLIGELSLPRPLGWLRLSVGMRRSLAVDFAHAECAGGRAGGRSLRSD